MHIICAFAYVYTCTLKNCIYECLGALYMHEYIVCMYIIYTFTYVYIHILKNWRARDTEKAATTTWLHSVT